MKIPISVVIVGCLLFSCGDGISGPPTKKILRWEPYWYATVAITVESNLGSKALCSAFFAQTPGGRKYLWTARHCVVFDKEGEYADNIEILLSLPTPVAGKDAIILVFNNINAPLELDLNRGDMARLPVDAAKIPLTIWPVVDAERLDSNGDTLEAIVLLVSHIQSLPLEDYCPLVQISRYMGEVEHPGLKSMIRVYDACVIGGRSGSPAVSIETGRIIGIQVLGAGAGKELLFVAAIDTFTYSSWFLDQLLHKRSPHLPQ